MSSSPTNNATGLRGSYPLKKYESQPAFDCDSPAATTERPAINHERRTTNRRQFLTATATTAGALLAGLPSGWVGSVYADDSPETKTMRFGIIALTDCAPIVMAHELGYFKKFGIESVVSKEASWAVIRDKLSLGENQATHMLIGMPIASTMGLAGSPVKPMVIPWILNRNGQAITLNNKLKQATPGKSYSAPYVMATYVFLADK